MTTQYHKLGPGFHHVALRATDFDASVRFYEDGMGFVHTYGWGEGDTRGALMDTGDGNYIEIFAGGTGPVEPVSGASGVFHYAVRVADTDAAYARALAAGARPQMEPKDLDLQGDPIVPIRIAFVFGPDGESIEFFQNEEL